jgi:hypothetical protein
MTPKSERLKRHSRSLKGPAEDAYYVVPVQPRWFSGTGLKPPFQTLEEARQWAQHKIDTHECDEAQITRSFDIVEVVRRAK